MPFNRRDHRVVGIAGVYTVGAGDHAQVAAVHLTVKLHRARNHIGVAGLARIQTLALNRHRALRYLHPRETVAVQQRTPGGQHAALGVNKTTAVTVNTGGVRHHHIRSLAGHLDPTVKLAWPARIHLVENHLRFPTRQPRVRVHVAPQLRVGRLAAVVEDHPLAVNVKLAIHVVRDPRRIGGLDIDLGLTARGVQHRGLLLMWGTAIRHNLGVGKLKGTAEHHDRRRQRLKHRHDLPCRPASARACGSAVTRGGTRAAARMLGGHHQ